MSQRISALHMAPAFSCMEIMDTIYSHLISDPQGGVDQHAFILSKGHGCLSQYVILHELGVLTDKDLLHYSEPGGQLGVHPDWGVPGIGASTGSLGHGLGMAVGVAYANRLANSQLKTYVVISDGELQEGSTWEAVMMAKNLKLSNLTLFVDLNDRISMTKLSEEHGALFPVAPKFSTFGWSVQEVDGHDSAALYRAATQESSDQPTVIVCNTTKGKGVSYMEDVPIWHYRAPSAEEYQVALAELAAQAEEVMA
ncbi:MAG: transketolase [Coxiella sp. (in: Bacteria)]|nr:MAG: transketolase [Coxiella sp. (in: g-proteobacteria)]